jgi:hypothetical protein
VRTPTRVLTPPPAISELPKLTRQVDRAPSALPDNRATCRLMAALSRSSWAAFWTTIRAQNQDAYFADQAPASNRAFDADLTDAETGDADQPKRQGEPAGETPGPSLAHITTLTTPTRGPNLPALGVPM